MGWTAATKFRAPIDIQLCFPKGSMGGLYICSMGDFYGKCIGNIPYINSMGLYILRIFILSNSIYVIMSIIVRSFFYFYLFYDLYGPISSFSPSNIYIYSYVYVDIYVYLFGCFRKQWYPKIIHLSRAFHDKPSILGYHYFWKHLFLSCFLLPVSKAHNAKKSSPDLLHLILSSESEGSSRGAVSERGICNATNLWLKVTFCTWKKRSLMEIHLFFQYISTSSEILQKLQPVMCVFTAFVWILFGNIVGNLSFRGLESLRVNFINISLSSMQIYMNHVYVPAPAKECQGVNSPCS